MTKDKIKPSNASVGLFSTPPSSLVVHYLSKIHLAIHIEFSTWKERWQLKRAEHTTTAQPPVAKEQFYLKLKVLKFVLVRCVPFSWTRSNNTHIFSTLNPSISTCWNIAQNKPTPKHWDYICFFLQAESPARTEMTEKTSCVLKNSSKLSSNFLIFPLVREDTKRKLSVSLQEETKRDSIIFDFWVSWKKNLNYQHCSANRYFFDY